MLNLLKIISTHTVSLLPEFLPYVLGASAFLLFISGGCLWIYRKEKLSFLKLLFLPYISLGFFIVVAYYLLYITPKPLETLTAFFICYVLAGLIQFYIRRKEIFYLFASSKNLKNNVVFLIGITILSSLMLFNFTYKNGIHDEYQHHAVVQLFLENNTYPFIDPYSPRNVLNNYYHVGLYFPVILTKIMYNTSVESALDLTKLILFFPIIPLFTAICMRIFHVRKIWVAGLIAFACLFSGPSLLFFDIFSSNVFLHTSYQLLYTPIFYELAGLTWFGLMFFLVYFFFFTTRYEEKKTGFNTSLLVFLLFSMTALNVINKAFLATYVVSIAVFLWWSFFFHKKTLHITFAHIFKIFVACGLIALVFIQSQYFRDMIIRFTHAREPLLWGFPYAKDATLMPAYAPIQNFSTIRGIGILWIFALFLLIRKIIMEQKNRIWPIFFLTIILIFLSATYFGQIDSSSLALNKLLRPVFFWTVFACMYYGILKEKHLLIKLISIVLVCSGVIPSLYFFLTANTWNIQRYWVVERDGDRKLIQAITKNSPCTLVTTNARSTSYLVANTTNACVQLCPTLSEKDCPALSTSNTVLYDTTSPEPTYQEYAKKHTILFKNETYILTQ